MCDQQMRRKRCIGKEIFRFDCGHRRRVIVCRSNQNGQFRSQSFRDRFQDAHCEIFFAVFNGGHVLIGNACFFGKPFLGQSCIFAQ